MALRYLTPPARTLTHAAGAHRALSSIGTQHLARVLGDVLNFPQGAGKGALATHLMEVQDIALNASRYGPPSTTPEEKIGSTLRETWSTRDRQLSAARVMSGLQKEGSGGNPWSTGDRKLSAARVKLGIQNPDLVSNTSREDAAAEEQTSSTLGEAFKWLGLKKKE